MRDWWDLFNDYWDSLLNWWNILGTSNQIMMATLVITIVGVIVSWLGSVAKNMKFSLFLFFDMEKSDERFQMASLPGRYNLGLCPVVLQIRNQLSRSGGNDVRTWT